MLRKDIHQKNRVSWNEATKAHNSHKRDQAAYFREGGNTLYPEEIELLRDLEGASIVHLQCNSGQDTISLARIGGNVTGVDISDTAISFARQLSADSGIPATFIRADVYDWLADAAEKNERFDVVFSSYGALVWLSDIAIWAKGVSTILARGGKLVLVDFHPYANVFGWDWTLRYPYFAQGKALEFDDGIGDYVALSGNCLAPSGYLEGVVNFKNPHPVKEFQWSIDEILSAILEAGLILKEYHEYPYTNGARLFKSMREEVGGRLYPPSGFPTLPLMYGLLAIKP
jgi:SAM-dependent methyltransferase